MINETPNEISTKNSRGNNKMTKFKKLFKNEKGLTLIELLAVIVILAIVAAIATPAIGNIIQNSRDKAILADASSMLSGAKLAIIDNACDDAVDNVTTCDGLELGSYVEGIPLVVGDTVTKTYTPATTGDTPTAATTTWAINYTKFAEIEGTQYRTGLGENDVSMTDQDLTTNLSK